MDSFEDLDAQLEQLQAQLKNDIQKVRFKILKAQRKDQFELLSYLWVVPVHGYLGIIRSY